MRVGNLNIKEGFKEDFDYSSDTCYEGGIRLECDGNEMGDVKWGLGIIEIMLREAVGLNHLNTKFISLWHDVGE